MRTSHIGVRVQSDGHWDCNPEWVVMGSNKGHVFSSLSGVALNIGSVWPPWGLRGWHMGDVVWGALMSGGNGVSV